MAESNTARELRNDEVSSARVCVCVCVCVCVSVCSGCEMFFCVCNCECASVLFACCVACYEYYSLL